MYRYANKIIANRIAEIQQRQFQILNYLDSKRKLSLSYRKKI